MIRNQQCSFVQKCILILSLLSLVVSAHSRPLSEKNILFYTPFNGSFDAEISRGSGSTTSATKAKLVEGRFGQGVLVGNAGSEIRYASDRNLNPESGTVSMWVRPVGWGKGDTYTRFFFSIHGVNRNGRSDDTDFAWLYKYFLYSVSWLVKQASPQTEFYYVRAASGDGGGVLRYEWETDGWAHLVATWSGNQFVLYINGKFAGSGYVPSRNLLRQPIKEFFIGGQNQRDEGTADTIIDDVLILDRPATPSEAESLFKNGIAALRDNSFPSSTPAFEVKSRYDLASNKTVLTSELIGLRSDEVKPFTISYLIENIETGKKVAAGNLAVKDLSQDTTIGDKPLPIGKYRVTASLRESGKVVSKSTSEFERFAKPEWLGNKLGLVNTTPKPWTPITKKGDRISCWGREYTWDNSVFPSSITTQGTELLSRPITLYAKIDGKSCQQLDNVSLRWGNVSPVRADFTAKGMLADVPVQVQGYLEFDGFSWYKIKVGDGKSTGRKLDFLSLDIPMRPDVASLMYICDPTKRTQGAVRPISMELTYFPDIWLGNEKLGLQWCTEDFKDWNLIDSTKMASIATEPDTTLLRLVMVDHPIVINRQLKYTTGLQATPVKPMPDDIRKWDMAVGTHNSNPPIMDTSALCYWSQWNRIDGSADGPYGYLVTSSNTFSGLKELKKSGVVPFLYWNTGMLWVGDPVLKIFGDWGRYDENAYQYTALITNNNNPAMQDYMVWRSWTLFKDNPELASSVFGYYLDSTPARWIKGLYTIIGTRELQKRSYLAVKKDWPDLRYMNHQSGQPNMSQLAFSDMMLTGEDLCSQQLATDMNYYNILTLDGMRAEYCGEKFGMPHIFLPNIGRAVETDKKKTAMVYGPEGIPAAEHVIGMAWVHDIPVYHAYMNYVPADQSYRTKKAFGWDKDTKFTGYWESNNPVQTRTDKSPVVTSVFKRKDRVMFVVMNNSDEDAVVELRPDWKALGISPRKSLTDAYIEQAEKPNDSKAITVPVIDGKAKIVVKARNFKALVAR